MDFILKMISFALKVLAVWAGFRIFWYIRHYGKDGLRMMVNAIRIFVKIGYIKLRRKLLEMEKEKEPEKEEEEDPTKVEAHVI